MTGPTTMLMAYLPSPPQGVWHLGPFPLRAYALCIIVGIIVGVWWGNRRWIARGGQDGEVLDIAIWAVPFGLIGGRIYHLLTDWPTYFGDGPKKPIEALYIWDGGLGIWGAVVLGGVGAWIGARRHGIKLPAFGDAVAPPILLAQAIGRLGNYFNQELYGRDTTLPWGLELFERVNSRGDEGVGVIDGVSNGHVVAVVHPTFLYEMVWNILIVIVLVLVDRYFRIGHGRLFALYVAGYCVGRFVVELLRDDHATLIAGIRINVFTAAIVFACAAAYFVVATKGRETGLSMYHQARAEELESQGAVGYVDDGYEWADDDFADDDGTDDHTADDDAGPDDYEDLDTDGRVEDDDEIGAAGADAEDVDTAETGTAAAVASSAVPDDREVGEGVSVESMSGTDTDEAVADESDGAEVADAAADETTDSAVTETVESDSDDSATSAARTATAAAGGVAIGAGVAAADSGTESSDSESSDTESSDTESTEIAADDTDSDTDTDDTVDGPSEDVTPEASSDDADGDRDPDEAPAPDTAAPDTAAPDTAASDAEDVSETGETGSPAESETTEAESTEPESTESETTEPETTETADAGAAAETSDSDESDSAASDADRGADVPAGTESADPPSGATEPADTEPADTEPVDTAADTARAGDTDTDDANTDDADPDEADTDEADTAEADKAEADKADADDSSVGVTEERDTTGASAEAGPVDAEAGEGSEPHRDETTKPPRALPTTVPAANAGGGRAGRWFRGRFRR